MPLRLHCDEEPAINMTPMVDVVFQLLIFFLLGTKFTEMERKIAVEIPKVTASSGLTEAPDRQIINVYRDGALTLDGASVSLEELTGRLATTRQQYSELAVLVRGDAGGQFQRVAEVLAACKQVGVRELAIAVMPVSQPKQ